MKDPASGCLSAFIICVCLTVLYILVLVIAAGTGYCNRQTQAIASQSQPKPCGFCCRNRQKDNQKQDTDSFFNQPVTIKPARRMKMQNNIGNTTTVKIPETYSRGLEQTLDRLPKSEPIFVPGGEQPNLSKGSSGSGDAF